MSLISGAEEEEEGFLLSLQKLRREKFRRGKLLKGTKASKGSTLSNLTFRSEPNLTSFSKPFSPQMSFGMIASLSLQVRFCPDANKGRAPLFHREKTIFPPSRPE